jgi:hypothetical protein
MTEANQAVYVSRGGCLGCVGLIVSCIIIWGLLFGFTYGGQHHGIGCSCDHGVTVQ